MKCVALVSLLLAVGMVAAASAQGVFWGGGYDHASTVAEGASRGMADVIRSAGAANMMNSQAAINYEAARKANIENRMQWTNTYFDMKKVNQEYRKAQRSPPPTQEQLIRMSKQQMPNRLAPNQLDPVTGELEWPTALQSEPFSDYRTQLEKLFSERAKNGYLTPDQYVKVRELTSSMTTQLQSLVRQNPSQYPTSASIDARKFVESLALEANMQPG